MNMKEEVERIAKELDDVAAQYQGDKYFRMQHGGTSEDSSTWFALCELRDALRAFLPVDETYQKADKM